MTTQLQVTITVNEAKISPARVTEEMVKGFVFLREGYFAVSEADLRLEIETLTVKTPKRQRHSRHVESSDQPVVLTYQSEDGEGGFLASVEEATEATNQEYIGANPEPSEEA